MVKWTPKSEEDLDKIREHIAKNFNVSLAIHSVSEIINHVEDLLTDNPLAGSIMESNPLFFKLIYKGNSIFYCENPLDHHLYIVYVQARGMLFEGQRISLNIS